MTTITFNVPGIHCGHCVHTIQTELGDLLGVKEVTASNETKEVVVSFDSPANEASIKSLLAEINYPAAG
jgi:copper chaperone CopZ